MSTIEFVFVLLYMFAILSVCGVLGAAGYVLVRVRCSFVVKWWRVVEDYFWEGD